MSVFIYHGLRKGIAATWGLASRCGYWINHQANEIEIKNHNKCSCMLYVECNCGCDCGCGCGCCNRRN